MKQVLDRIFKEITGLRRVVKNDEDAEWNRAIYQCEEIVYKHMDDVPDADVFRWIPVEERLPNEKEFIKEYRRNHHAAEFIVMIEGATLPTTLYYLKDTKSWVDENQNYYRVVAWMPLPEPYKEDN